MPRRRTTPAASHGSNPNEEDLGQIAKTSETKRSVPEMQQETPFREEDEQVVVEPLPATFYDLDEEDQLAACDAFAEQIRRHLLREF
jgi:hypothetical protein